MKTSTVNTVISRFLKSAKPEVIALKGAWGVGKTFAWNKFLTESKEEIKLPNYCYVSLFGVSSIRELRTTIFTKTQSIKLLGTSLDAETINTEWFGIISEKSKTLFRKGSELIKELPYGKNITVALETIAPHFCQNTIVCLDDFERLTSSINGIKPEEVLGLISELKEEKNCKVILIFNEEKLSDKTIYEKYREKVVDIELLYDPSPEEAAEVALPGDLPYLTWVKKYCISLKIKNIRVLRKISEYVKMVNNVTNSFHEGVNKQAVHTLILAAWCHFDTHDAKPTLAFLREWNRNAGYFKKLKGEQIDPTHERWNEQLQIYGLINIDEFDLSIFNIIERGYLEESGFEKAAQSKDVEYKAHELEQSYSASWRLFHDSFSDNADELILSLYESFKKSVKFISPLNLSGTTTLFRELGRDDLANELIDFYLNARSEEKEIFDLERLPFFGDIADTEVKRRFKERINITKTIMPLAEAVIHIADHSGWSDSHIEPLMAASEDDFFALFKQDHGDQLHRIVSCCLQFEGFEEKLKPIGAKARAALIRIGKENPLNARRVLRHGITIE